MQPGFDWIGTVEVAVGPPQQVGPVRGGERLIIPILGGRIEGPRLAGEVLPGGADFQLLVTDDLAELDARYVLETDGGDLIYVTNHALRTGPAELMARLRRGESVDPADIYFRCAPRFRAVAGRWEWLNSRLFVGTGERHPGEVRLDVFAVE